MNHQITMLLTNAFNLDVRVYKEAVYLISQGWAVTILCWDKDPSLACPEQENLDGIEVVRFQIPSVAGSGKKQIPAFLRYICSCRKYLKSHPCDYLHCHDLDGALTGYLSRKRRTPMVLDFHEFYEKGRPAKRKFMRKLTLFLAQRAAAVIFVGKYGDHPAYAAIRDKLHQLRNYPDTDMVEARPKSESDLFRVGYHGAVRSQIPEFTALFEAVRNLPDVRVDINGGGIDLPALKELEKQYENVYVHGPYNGATESSRLYEQTDALFCGYNPANPNYQGDTEVVKFYEAIHTGTPMIMTKNLGMGKKVTEFGFGIACSTRDSEEIREAILKLKNDRAFWQTCSENERACAAQYDWKKAVTVLDEIYRK